MASVRHHRQIVAASSLGPQLASVVPRCCLAVSWFIRPRHTGPQHFMNENPTNDSSPADAATVAEAVAVIGPRKLELAALQGGCRPHSTD